MHKLARLFSRYQNESDDDGDPGAGGGTGDDAGGTGETGNEGAGWGWDESIPGEGDRPEFLDPKFKTVRAQAEGYKDLAANQGKYGANFGAPDGDYELSLPEGIQGEFDTENALLKAVQEEARDMNLSQDAFNRLLHAYVENEASIVANRDEDIANAAKELGENGEQQLADMWDKLNKVLPKEQAEALDAVLGDVNAIKGLQALLGNEATLPGDIPGDVTGEDKESARQLRFQVYPEGHIKQGKQMYGDDAAHTKKVDELYKKLYPGDDIQIVG